MDQGIPNRLPPAELPVAKTPDDVVEWLRLWLLILLPTACVGTLIFTLTGVTPS